MWKPVKEAPHDHWPVAVAIRLTCECGFGGITILVAARKKGEWVFPEFNHTFEIMAFVELDRPPTEGMN